MDQPVVYVYNDDAYGQDCDCPLCVADRENSESDDENEDWDYYPYEGDD